MAYSVDFRKKVVEYLLKGHSQRAAASTFGIHQETVNQWYQQYRKTGSLKKKLPIRKFRKIDPQKLKIYVMEHPDVYLKEIGEVFGCSDVAVLKALRRLGITRKKTKKIPRTKT